MPSDQSNRCALKALLLTHYHTSQEKDDEILVEYLAAYARRIGAVPENGLSLTQTRTMARLIGATPVAHEEAELMDIVDHWIANQLPVYPVVLLKTIPYTNGEYDSHAYLFIPKHSKKIPLPTSTFFDDMNDPILAHGYRHLIPCLDSCPCCAED